MMTKYTTSGSVRGSCGHAHRTIGAAHACYRRDHAGCVSQGGYSDRVVLRTDGEPFSDDEDAELDAIECDQ